MSKYFVLLLIFTLVISCDFFHISKTEKPIAKVEDKYLYPSHIDDIFPEFITKEDSLSILDNYINNWIINQLILEKAELNLSYNKREIKKQLNDYENSLIRFAYEQEVINQYLDTIISSSEIEKYYYGNIKNFELKENIVKAVYIKIDKNAPKLSNVKQWYKLNYDYEFDLLKSYALQYAKTYYLQDSIWINFEKLLNIIPIKTNNPINYLKKNRYIEIEDSSSIYLLNIIDYKIKDRNSPLNYVENTIKSIILNQRKFDLISNMEEELYNDAVQNKTFEIY